jgi:ribosomal protein S13
MTKQQVSIEQHEDLLLLVQQEIIFKLQIDQNLKVHQLKKYGLTMLRQEVLKQIKLENHLLEKLLVIIKQEGELKLLKIKIFHSEKEIS